MVKKITYMNVRKEYVTFSNVVELPSIQLLLFLNVVLQVFETTTKSNAFLIQATGPHT